MKITRRDIANYRLLGILLDKDRRKLQKYVEKRPSCYSGKVYGSNPQFPYEPRGFTIGGCSEHEQVKMKEWEENCRIMEEQIKTDMLLSLRLIHTVSLNWLPEQTYHTL